MSPTRAGSPDCHGPMRSRHEGRDVEGNRVRPNFKRPHGPGPTSLCNQKGRQVSPDFKRPKCPCPVKENDLLGASASPSKSTEADRALEDVLSVLRRYKGDTQRYSVQPPSHSGEPAVICKLSHRKEIITGCLIHRWDCKHTSSECAAVHQLLSAAGNPAVPLVNPASPGEANLGAVSTVEGTSAPSTGDIISPVGLFPVEGTQVYTAQSDSEAATLEHTDPLIVRRRPLQIVKELRSVGTQDDLRYHISNVWTIGSDSPVPVVMLLSHHRG